MSKIISEVLERFRIIQLLWITFLITAILTFLDVGILDKIGILQFKKDWRMWIGILLIVSIVGLVVIYIERLYSFIYEKVIFPKKLYRNIKTLNKDEYFFLINYFYNDAETCFIKESRIPISNGMPAALLSKNILLPALLNTIYDDHIGICAVYHLCDEAYKFLNDSLLNGYIIIFGDKCRWFK